MLRRCCRGSRSSTWSSATSSRRLVRTTSRTRVAGEPRVHRREDAFEAPTRGRLRRRRRPLLLRRRHGRVRPGDFVTALRAGDAREGAGREGDLRRSRELGGARAIEEAGGVPLVNRVGHAFIKHRMREEDALFAGEVCALLLPRLHAGRHGRRPLPRHARRCSRAGKPLSELLAPVPGALLHHRRSTPPSRTSLQAPRDRGALRRRGRADLHLDGVSVDFDDWHFNVRPSNTELLLRLNLEALSEPEMEARRDEVLDLIRS